jgi:1-acyl-sn-glycerol-3-phosphate acyltransferase
MLQRLQDWARYQEPPVIQGPFQFGCVGNAGGLGGAQMQYLSRKVPVVQGLCSIDALVALQPYFSGTEHHCQRLRQAGLADAGITFEEQWSVHPKCQKCRGRQAFVGQVAGRLESSRQALGISGDASDGLHMTYGSDMEPVYTSVISLARLVFAVQGLKFTMNGSENVPRVGGAVMAINHTGYMDFTYGGLAALPSKRLVRFMAKDEVFKHRISGPLMRGMHHIPVDRDAGAGSYRAAVNALKDGEIVGVFPEATISRSFELKEFKSGAVRMAAAAGVPILPTVIWGSQRVWTKDHPKRLGRTNIPIIISVGEPLSYTRKDDLDAATDNLRDRMTELLHKAQQGYPALSGDELTYLPARLGGTAPTPERAAEMDATEAAERAARRAAQADGQK